MAELTRIPLIDGFETELAQQYTGGLGTVYLNDTPAFTFPAGVRTYMTINPGKSIQQVVEIDSKGAGTVNVSSITIEKGNAVNYSAQTHAAGSKVIISDNYQFWKDIQSAINASMDEDGSNGSTYADTAARDSALGGDGVATKNYRMIKAGAAYYNYNLTLGQWQIISTGTAPLNGSEVVAGVFQQSTLAAFNAGTDIGSTGAQNVPKNSQIKSAFDVIGQFGNGSDGDVVVTTTITLTRNMHYNNLTVTSPGIINTDGYKVYVKGTLSGNGTIRNNGNAGGNGSGATAGVAGSKPNDGSLYAGVAGVAGVAGSTVAGVAGSPGVSTSPCYSSLSSAAGGASGNGLNGSGASGGSSATSTRGALYDSVWDVRSILSALTMPAAFYLSPYKIAASSGSGAGGAGAGGFGAGGGGGGSGSTGGMVYMSAYIFNFTGSITAIGGNGGNGGNSTTTGGNAGGGGGGGGGGNGGVIAAIYRTLVSLGTTSVLGGNGGTGGAPTSGGTSGATGSSGQAGVLIQKAI